MKLRNLLLLSLLTSCAATPGPRQEGPIYRRPTHRVGIYLGERDLDRDQYLPSDEQTSVGVEYSSQTPGYPVGFEVGFLSSYESDNDGAGDDFKVGVWEAFWGIRKTWGSQHVHPYLGGGVSLVTVGVETDDLGRDDDDDDTSLAGYVHGGVMFHLSEIVYFGLDVRTLVGSDIDIRSTNIEDADYLQFSVLLGFSF